MLQNRLSAGVLPAGDIDVTYMIDGMDISEVAYIDVDETIAFWVEQHALNSESELEDWEVNEAKQALESLSAAAREGYEWALLDELKGGDGTYNWLFDQYDSVASEFDISESDYARSQIVAHYSEAHANVAANAGII